MAGVSTSTVSLVLNDKDSGRVGERTRQQVMSAAESLGYRVDHLARGLATGRSGFIGYAAPDVNPFFADLQVGLLEALNPDYQLMTVTTDLRSSSARRNLSQMLALNPEALVVSTVEPEQIRELRPTCPVLILDAPEAESDYPRINLDLEKTAAEVAQYLVDLGHRKFVHLEIENGSSSLRVRRAAFINSATGAGPGYEVFRAESSLDGDAARLLVRQSWKQWSNDQVTAIVCGSDAQAMGVVVALKELGLRVPEDVSVVGALDQPFSKMLRPALTTVQVPAREMGANAGKVVRAMLTGAGEFVEDHTVEVLRTQLIIRESTGPAPGSAPDPVLKAT